MTEIDPKKDFDPDKLLQDHHKDISSLIDRVLVLEQKLSNPEQLAQTLEAASSDSKKLDKLFSKLFCNMMKNDDDVKASLVDKINTLDRAEVNSLLKKFGGKAAFVVWTITTMILAAWIGHKIGK
jgi:predicted ribosome quality control (RQC) complex YloA/Tae2 family protein